MVDGNESNVGLIAFIVAVSISFTNPPGNVPNHSLTSCVRQAGPRKARARQSRVLFLHLHVHCPHVSHGLQFFVMCTQQLPPGGVQSCVQHPTEGRNFVFTAFDALGDLPAASQPDQVEITCDTSTGYYSVALAPRAASTGFKGYYKGISLATNKKSTVLSPLVRACSALRFVRDPTRGLGIIRERRARTESRACEEPEAR